MNLVLSPGHQRATLFDSMRRGFEVVSNGARHVTLHPGRLAEFVREIPDTPPENVLDRKHHFYGDEEDTAAYLITLNSVNFGSGYEPFLREEGWEFIDDSLYYTISTRLKNHFVRKGVMSSRELSGIPAEEVLGIFELNSDGEKSQEFARRMARSLREIGTVVTEEYRGSFLNLINWAAGSTEKMVRTLIRLHNFNDMHRYRGHAIAFHKRAQSTIADIADAFDKEFDKEPFRDIRLLTVLADNAIPHVLRTEGVLTYSDELQAIIDKGEEIESGSEEEIEIRACAAHAVELMSRQKNAIALDVDRILWHLSEEDDKYKKTQPHRTVSNFY